MMQKKKTIGNQESMRALVQKTKEQVPAYKKFLAQNGKTGDEPFEELPVMDKKNYMTHYPYAELMPPSHLDNATIFTSAGSSGKKPFFWIYEGSDLVNKQVQPALEMIYDLPHKKTLVIIALALGCWMGGDAGSFLAKMMSLSAKYPLTSVSPGNKIDEIITIIENFGGFFEQILIASSPTTFSHLRLTAEHRKKKLPYEKMCYLFGEEGFTEDFRISLQKIANAPETKPIAYSIYGSADTGLIGLESPSSVALRKLCFHNHEFAAQIGINKESPLFFHYSKANSYLETIGEEFCITAWQGIPLVRYNLHDRIQICSWPEIQENVKNFTFHSPIEKQLAEMVIRSPATLPDVFAVFGRADSCLILAGTKIYESMLDDVMRSEHLSKYLTGMYKAKLGTIDFQSYIDIVVELKEGIKETPEIIDTIENLIEAELAQINQEYCIEYENLFKNRKAISGLKSVKVTAVPWSTISQELETRIKVRGIIPNS